MLFNSFEFLLVFLPITVLLFYLVGSTSRSLAIRWLIVASLLFYGAWRPVNVLIIAPSIAINFVLASVLLRLRKEKGPNRMSKVVLVVGILFNVVFLGIFKYDDFIAGSINDAFGTSLILQHLILPLGISFITFQKIAFLVDVQAGRVRSFTFQEYCTFVLFFPQLIAGPIVHYREMMPQFHAVKCRFDRKNFAVGLTLLLFGLFKKVVLADSIAQYVTPIYERSASGGGGDSLLLAWMAAIGFTLQIYFDFSGYSDMALGLARFFGITLPQNFYSPLRASSIIDFWLRWHITLTRFLTGYIYNPLLLWLTRRRAAKGLPGFRGREATAGAFLSLLMFPTVTTMFVSGLWHGAGYGYVIWGVLHGFYITVNHWWRMMAHQLWSNRSRYDRFMKPVGLVLTLITVTATMIFFRASTITSAIDLERGLIGLNGVALPQDLANHLTAFGGIFHNIGVLPEPWHALFLAKAAVWIFIPGFIALACPNTLQIMRRYEPALGVNAQENGSWIERILQWDASLPWAVAISSLAVIAIQFMGGPTEFLYWQF